MHYYIIIHYFVHVQYYCTYLYATSTMAQTITISNITARPATTAMIMTLVVEKEVLFGKLTDTLAEGEVDIVEGGVETDVGVVKEEVREGSSGSDRKSLAIVLRNSWLLARMLSSVTLEILGMSSETKRDQN